jgi:hypothetical protein
MHKYVLACLSLVVIQKTSFSQEILPEVSVTSVGKKVVVSWYNPFTSLSDILIQRSPDSLKNFKTIGNVLNVSAKTNGFMDNTDFDVPQYYRVFITFRGGTYLFSSSHRPSAQLQRPVPEIAETYEAPEISPIKKIKSQPLSPVKNVFVPSRYIFTNKENNVIISLPDAARRKYSVKFFEQDGTPVFELKKIPEPYLTLDKVNFIHSGLFNFELYADGVLIEKNRLYIPKDGKSMPALDAQGQEIR